ncbi:TetR/AcrR family transcriptional regulator [Rhodococcus sp. NPDC078407]|uniref:TetR/AcrR family transcriptional regulator n=1 Tax=Rhodococcus sp. NPDC078407 TaxID=3364509 RepID=UPI0037C9A9FA
MSDGGSRPKSDGRKRRWEQHNTDRRRHIIAAAMTVLTRDIAPGERLTTAQISAEAGVHRTGLYRHFRDRTDLDTAIQRAICDQLTAALVTSFELTGTPRDVVHRVVSTYVRWVAEHPAWTRFVEQDVSAESPTPLEETNAMLAEQLEVSVAAFLALVNADLSPEDWSLVRPWVAGLVSGCMGAVRSWNGQTELRTGLDHFATFLADTIWLQVKGLGASRGIAIPQVPLESVPLEGARETQPNDVPR